MGSQEHGNNTIEKAVLTSYHLYIGIDYPSSKLIDSAARRSFSSDAKEVGDLLSCPATRSIFITGPVTLANLRQEMQTALDPNNRGRNVVIYFAGHAVREQDTTYLVTADSTPGDPGLDLDWLCRYINHATHISRTAVILDCCHSGCPGNLNRNRYWLAACSPESTVIDDFHNSLVTYLAGNSREAVTLEGLHEGIARTSTFAQPELTGTLTTPLILRPSTSLRGIDGKPWADLAHISLAQRGRLRTAFPTDLSFAELYAEGLFVVPTIIPLDSASIKSPISRETLLTQLTGGKSFLVLGQPGCGKSFLSYLCQRSLVESGYNVIAIDAFDLPIGGEANPHNRVGGNSIFANFPKNVSNASEVNGRRPIFLLDSLDEIAAGDFDLESLREALALILQNGSLMAFCRQNEYENSLFNIIKSSYFDHIVSIKEWRVDKEFVEYIDVLTSRGYPLSPLVEIAKQDASLREIVTRPLHARMLSFIWLNQNKPKMFSPPTDFATLYRDYIDGFSRTCAEKLSQVSPIKHYEISSAWRDVSWAVFTKSLFSGGFISARSINPLLAEYGPALIRGARAILQEHSRLSGAVTYLHYSFYEFLVAHSFSIQLLHAMRTDAPHIAKELFRQDMTHEIRLYSARLLRSETESNQITFSTFLASIYSELRNDPRSQPNRQTACNLVAYFLGRSIASGTAALVSALLGLEPDPFLQSSLYWAACNQNDFYLYKEYAGLLQTDSHLAALNRGYSMYYYGDIDRRLEPPYVDNAPNSSWTKTREKTFAMMDEPDYSTKQACRRALDIETALSFLEFRGECLQPNEETSLAKALEELKLISDLSDDIQSLRARIHRLGKGNHA